MKDIIKNTLLFSIGIPLLIVGVILLVILAVLPTLSLIMLYENNIIAVESSVVVVSTLLFNILWVGFIYALTVKLEDLT